MSALNYNFLLGGWFLTFMKAYTGASYEIKIQKFIN